MIESADEFIRLRESEVQEEYHKAGHDEAPLEIWYEIIDRYPEKKKWVAYNKTIPVEILQHLAQDENPDVRFSVAMKRKLTLELFELLAIDSEESVRMRIACNSKTLLHILQQLAKDQSIEVAMHAKKRLRD
jgi:hypothetical protein